ncbi:hypothetical protein KSF_083930 [Reticulibacter mediterranei]|uniref:Resolvase/invertase-type recombinase catalytic domain-containing protein n=1 Tax=Reticulibacter mediterranei TaxID=2778369 RepID=A0A8J3ITN8_9CHLR|nr:recombinase family protein [Reticulibacter mediterranei]GHO98345.1 hypothetical protein KSF_083930 [Reticulibacter mediterranei]
MARKILPTPPEPERHYHSWKQELLTDLSCQVYPRVSTPEQKKNVSAEMQQDKSFAILCGWTEEMIIMDADDLGLSGQLKMEDRPAFVKMLRRIADGTIKTVIAAQVDRLFRDRWGAEYSKFMEICYTYGVKVVTPNPWRTGIEFIYDFSIPWHVDKFRRKCEEAWSYLENHVYGRMLAAQKELGERGFWTGGSIAIGYTIDRREKVDGKRNPDYRKYTIYEPHAEVVRWLFQRFRELNGRMNDLMREIERRPILFKAFDSNIDAELYTCYANTKVYAEDGETIIGYTIASTRGLGGLLSNPAYVGYWIYNNVVVSTNNHDAIVDYGVFLYAFNRLSATNLDATPNTAFLEKKQRYVKKHKADKPALLKNHIEAADEQFTIFAADVPLLGEKTKGTAVVFYGLYPRKSGVRPGSKYMIPAPDIDGFFLERFIERLQQAEGFDNFLDMEKAEQEAQLKLRQDIERDIKAAEAQMAKIEAQAEVGGLTDSDLQAKANARYIKLKEDVIRLRERLRELTGNKPESEKRLSYKQMMRAAGDCWDEVILPEEIPLMIDAFVKMVIIELLSPRFYTMTIHWKDPDWGIDGALCYRHGNPSLRWSKEEDELLEKHYPTTPKEELLQLIPGRTIFAMRHRASTKGIARLLYEPDIPTEVSWNEWQLMQEKQLTVDQIKAMRHETREKPHWTKEEDDILRKYYPVASRKDLLQAMPHRNYKNMIYRARRLGLSRNIYEEEGLSTRFSQQDTQVIEEYKLEVELLQGVQTGKLMQWSTRPRFSTELPGATRRY